MAPSDVVVRIFHNFEYDLLIFCFKYKFSGIKAALEGLRLIANQENFEEYMLTKEAYLENGQRALHQFQY
jgi:hypothetical protein